MDNIDFIEINFNDKKIERDKKWLMIYCNHFSKKQFWLMAKQISNLISKNKKKINTNKHTLLKNAYIERTYHTHTHTRTHFCFVFEMSALLDG